jgi:lysophospholipase L1-like esterase
VRPLARISPTVLALLAVTAAAQPFHPAPPPREPAQLGVGIQRTMTHLATSTPEKRNKVRILFYGQSITEQKWSKAVADDLRARFPHADLEIENRAIGGFSSQLLVRPAEHDLYPFYPDLLIFHVYGANPQYEEIIRNVRSRTTAEVLMQRDHLTKWPPETIDQGKDKGAWWDNLMNEKILPEIASKYGCGLADVRGGWIDYLKANDLQPKDLLSDSVHLNEHGNHLMAELIKQYLVHRPELPKDGWKDLVTTLEAGKDVSWKGNKLMIEFKGNRVDVLADTRVQDAPLAGAKVLIDGKRPSEFPQAYRITRPAPGPWSPLFVSRVDHEKPLILEEWTLKVTVVSPDGKTFKYAVSGSVTGDDGSGTSDQPFTSPSGRVKLDPAAFFRGRGDKLPVGYESKWKVLPMFTDTYAPPQVSDRAREYSTTLIQGIPNGKHTLELIAESPTPPTIGALRVYRPPVR